MFVNCLKMHNLQASGPLTECLFCFVVEDVVENIALRLAHAVPTFPLLSEATKLQELNLFAPFFQFTLYI